MVVVIALHNLPKFSVGNRGFFHFRSHITSFVEKHWTTFFPGVARRKRRNVLGTIAGVLSQHSPGTFLSGTDEIKSIGWWKLTKNLHPVDIEKLLKNRSKRSATTGSSEDDDAAKRIKTEEDFESFEIKTEKEDGSGTEISSAPVLPDQTSSVKLEEVAPIIHEAKVDDNRRISESAQNQDRQQSDDEIYHKLKSIIEGTDVDVPPWVHRYYRKLHVDRIKQKHLPKKVISAELEDSPLGRYCKASNPAQRSLLAGPSSLHCFQSPYTKNLLQPFIFRDKKMSPRWLKLMCELKFKVLGVIPERSSIDFCFASAHHISAVNSLLQELFWPGIDMSDALSYPDFTVVALYKKLVIGCAFLVPDACHNEAYISFLAVRPGWDRSGIASFMLYHLTQTSHGKDMTLHVSASNPAVCLYQKFGFKTEELALNFYEKFLPLDSPHSPHALFLRLTR